MTDPSTDRPMADSGMARAKAWADQALGIARRLVAEAVWADGMCVFHGATTPINSPLEPPRFKSTGGDVYEGTAGIARFLAWTASVTGDDTLRATALGALRHAMNSTTGWPLYTGAMGAGVVALEVARCLDEPSLVAPATRLIERASEQALRDAAAPFDLLVGIAGVIVGLAAAIEYDVDGDWRRRAAELGNVLLETAVADGPDTPGGRPLSWPLAPGSSDRLCGLAHGASGAALAFETLARVAPVGGPGAEGWRAAAQRARRWERAHYSEAAGSWADLRRPEDGLAVTAPGYPHMWCHGSIGVAAERLGALESDLLARADAIGALAGVRMHVEQLAAGPVGPGGTDALNGCLCHGLGGAIDLLVDAWRRTGDSTWIALAGTAADVMVNDARRQGGWRCGVPGGWRAPGLMLGEAGIGWALLRLADPERLPSGWWPGSGLRPAAVSPTS